MEILKSNGKDIKVWTDVSGIEPDALQQLYRMSKMPFIYDHIAVMPDVHVGKGATVGSVIATKGAIMPAAVGVDIGCFTGDTLIPLIDGKDYKIKDLLDKDEIIVFACDKNSKIVAASAKAKLTRKEASLVKVTLDNNEEIICTPDHEFMLRDGSYKQAYLLEENESLMPFYSKTDKEGYKLVRQPHSGGWQKVHWIVARSGLMGKIPSFEKQKTVIHHKNFSESDNRPENLIFMGDRDHSSYHRSLVEKNTHWQSEEFERKRIEAIKTSSKLPERQKQLSEVGRANIENYMKNFPEHFKNATKNNGQRGKKFLVSYNQSEKGKEKSKEIANRFYTCEVCNEDIKSPIGLHNHRKKVHLFNHKVKSVMKLDYKEDVYCLSVPDYNNFALKAGVFVHNCGMLAAQTNLTSKDLPDSLSKLRDDIENIVPVGKNSHKHTRFGEKLDFTKLSVYDSLDKTKVMRAQSQIGTLGGGNHFIEICLDQNDNVWLMLHSGSRNIGNEVAMQHIKIAKGEMKKAFINLEDPDLAYLSEQTQEFKNYVNDLFWCQEYAMQNRRVMFDNIFNTMKKIFPQIEIVGAVTSCHHNYVSIENHFGENVFVTRKGAIKAGVGDVGIIPGSMGTKSYIIKGLGNPESFNSCSHGAGRRMSRTKAKSVFTSKDLVEQTKGVECRKDHGVVDEIPGAYKDIDEVMRNQEDLVNITAVLKQVVCIKG